MLPNGSVAKEVRPTEHLRTSLTLQGKPTEWNDAGRAQGVKLTAGANPSRYEPGQIFGWGRQCQADAMPYVGPQSTKVRGVGGIRKNFSVHRESQNVSIAPVG